MAKEVIIDNKVYKIRSSNPFVFWFLCTITLGIYFLYWVYSINEEVSQHNPDYKLNGCLAVLLFFIPFVSWIWSIAWLFKISDGIKRMNIFCGITNRINPSNILILFIVGSIIGSILVFSGILMALDSSDNGPLAISFIGGLFTLFVGAYIYYIIQDSLNAHWLAHLNKK